MSPRPPGQHGPHGPLTDTILLRQQSARYAVDGVALTAVSHYSRRQFSSMYTLANHSTPSFIGHIIHVGLASAQPEMPVALIGHTSHHIRTCIVGSAARRIVARMQDEVTGGDRTTARQLPSDVCRRHHAAPNLQVPIAAVVATSLPYPTRRTRSQFGMEAVCNRPRPACSTKLVTRHKATRLPGNITASRMRLTTKARRLTTPALAEAGWNRGILRWHADLLHRCAWPPPVTSSAGAFTW